MSRIKKFGRDWAIFQNPDKPEVILTRGGIAIATIYPGPVIGPEQAMRDAAWANAVLIGEAVAALQHAEGGDEPPAVERKIPSCVMWADGSGGLRIPVGYSPSGFGTHPVETLGAPGSTGTPSRWPQSSDDTGERGDTSDMALEATRLGREAAQEVLANCARQSK